MRAAFILSLLVILTSSCAGLRIFEPAYEQNANAEVLRYDGKPYIRSVMERTEVSAQLIKAGRRNVVLDVFFYNDTDLHFTISPNDVKVTGYNELGVPATFRVFTAEQFIRRRNTRSSIIGGAVALVSLASVIALAADGVAAGGVENQLLWWGIGTLPSVVGATRPVAPYLADDGLARPHTLFPGKAYQGNVMIRGNPEYFHLIEIQVPINVVWHRFDFVPPLRK